MQVSAGNSMVSVAWMGLFLWQRSAAGVSPETTFAAGGKRLSVRSLSDFPNMSKR
jgi:hypothetical protein